MTELNKEQVAFLKQHNVSLKFVFNADGLRKTEYKEVMKDLNKMIAYNVTPCTKFGHTLRTRSGHCCQCNTAHLEFQKRNDSAGIVYIAVSSIKNVIKIGFTKSIEIRSESLNRTQYAGINDWKIVYAIKSDSAGKVENRICTELSDYSSYIDYEHDNHIQLASEIFKIDWQQAKIKLVDICNINRFDFEITVNNKHN